MQDLKTALIIAAGFACGSFFGGMFAASLPKDTLKLVFGFVLVYVAGYTIFYGSDRTTCCEASPLHRCLRWWRWKCLLRFGGWIDLVSLPPGRGGGEGTQLRRDDDLRNARSFRLSKLLREVSILTLPSPVGRGFSNTDPNAYP